MAGKRRAHSVLLEIATGIAIGWAVGRAFGWITSPSRRKQAGADGRRRDVIAATLIAYDLCEIADDNGFLGVFVSALAIRQAHRSHDSTVKCTLLLRESSVSRRWWACCCSVARWSGMLTPLGWAALAAAALILLLGRPVAGLIGFQAAPSAKLTLAFFGIRGVDSLNYMSFGLHFIAGTPDPPIDGLCGLSD